MAAATNHFLILYASQTGNAKSIAEGLHEEAEKKSLNTSVHCVNEFEKDKFPFAEEQNIVFVVSTTGEGEPPDHALRYWRKLKKKTLPSDFLKHINYTLLGVCLGDTNYTNFCNMGKMLDKRMRDLGATPFYDPGFADDGTGLEIVVEPWIDGLWAAMKKLTEAVSLPKESSSKEIVKESSFIPVPETGEALGKTAALKDSNPTKEETTLPPLPPVTTSPNPSRKKNDDVISKLASKTPVKTASSSTPVSSPKPNFVPRLNPMAMTKLSPLASPGLRHLELAESDIMSSGPTSNSTSPSSSNQIWTGYRKGALKPIDVKVNELTIDMGSSNLTNHTDDLVLSSTSKTVLTPLQGRVRSVSFTGASLPAVDDTSMEGIRSSPNLCQALQNEDKDRSKSSSNLETSSAQELTDLGGTENNTESGFQSNGSTVVLESGIQETTETDMGNSLFRPKCESTVSPTATATRSLLMEQLRSLSNDVDQPLTTPSRHLSYLEVDLQEPPDNGGSPLVSSYPFHSLSYGPGTRNYTAVLSGDRVLTSPDAGKVTMEMTFVVKDEDFTYEPGDAFGFICPNRPEEVEFVLNRLQLSDVEDHSLHLTIQQGTQAKKPSLPKHVPQGCTIRQFFTHCCDVRGIPKKGFLFMLAGFTSNPMERRRLEELSSRQGAADYTKLFIEHHFDFIDVLAAFPSTQPSLQCLLENMPKLQPRYYSVASSPLVSRHQFKIVFNIIELPVREWNKAKRLGLCTSWLYELCSMKEKTEIAIFSRGMNPFHLPPSLSTPVIMCGPGTGVSPYLGFVEHFSHLHANTELGESWLFYGCRHPDKDHLYKAEITDAVGSGAVSRYVVSYSRYQVGGPLYVQDNMRVHGEELSQLIMKRGAVVYVCGDAKNMSKNIKDAFFDILSQYIKKEELTSITADKILMKMRESGHYVLDLWG
jgi:methionine synthase reductase